MVLLKPLAPLLALILFVAESNCLTIGSFEKVTDNNLSRHWGYKRNGVTYETDGVFVNNTVWLTGLKHVTSKREDSWLLARLNSANNTWKSYTVSPYENYLYKVFTLSGRLFMLLTFIDRGKVSFGALVVFQDTQSGRWHDVSIESPSTLCTGPSRHSNMSVSNSNPTGNTAYVGISCFGDEGGTRMEFYKLTVDTSGQRVKAQMTPLAATQSDRQEPLSHVFDRNGTVLILTGHNRSDCYYCLREDHIYTLAAGSDQMNSSSITRSNSVPSWIRVGKAVQLDNYVLFFGGRVSNPVNNGKMKSDEDKRRTIRVLNLDTLEWSDLNVALPSKYQPILDQAGKRLFAVSIRNGVKVARISL